MPELKPVCYLDMDGVLVDFVGGSFELHGKSLPRRDVKYEFPIQMGFADTWAREFWDPLGHDFWKNLKWTAEGKAIVDVCKEAFGPENIAIVTTPCPTAGCKEGKEEWIKQHLPEFTKSTFFGSAKHLLAGTHTVLIDDHEPHWEKTVSRGGQAVLVPRSWNKRKAEICDDGHVVNLDGLLQEIHTAAAAARRVA